jgi:hypothetical protein
VSNVDTRFGLNVRWGARTGAPSAHIFLQSIVRHSKGMLSVTPVCSSLAELEGQVEHLKEELDEVLGQARWAFMVDHRAAAGDR